MSEGRVVAEKDKSLGRVIFDNIKNTMRCRKLCGINLLMPSNFLKKKTI